jgi:Ricin-type beta-trefoil lectin domain-like
LLENDFFGARYRLVAVHSGRVLQVRGSSTANGVLLEQWDWNDGDHQKFRVEPAGGSNLLNFRLVAVHSGKVLDVSGNSGANGARLIQWDWHGGDNQQWLLAGLY